MKHQALRRTQRPDSQQRARPWRVGLVGLGEAAHNIHIPACKQLSRVSLVAGVDPRPEAQARFTKSVAGARVYALAADMLACEQLDWVIVATPPSSHQALCLQALAAGAHVFCEKPFVVEAAEANVIAEAAQRAARVVVVNHEFPYMPIFSAVRRLAGSAELGRLAFLQFWQHVLEASPGEDHWRAENLTMREFGTHVVDLAVRLYADLPERVFACMASPGGRAGSDLVDVVTLQFSQGRIASIVLDRVCHGPHRYLEMRADGTQASLRASFGGRAAVGIGVEPRSRRPWLQLDLAAGGQAWLESAEGRAQRVVARNGFNPFADATAALLGEALDAVERGEPPPSDARQAQQIVRLVDTIYASAQRGEALSFSGDHA